MNQKVGLVYYSATLLGHQMTYVKACKIAGNFTLDELRRIYLKIKNTGRRAKLAIVDDDYLDSHNSKLVDMWTKKDVRKK